MSRTHDTFAEYDPIPPDEQPLANTDGRFFYSDYITNDVTLPRDDPMMMGFEKRTGLAYRPNSCLASCCLLICYAGDGRPVWCKKNLWTEKRAAGIVKNDKRNLEVPTYETLARLCGVAFGEDGSLRLTLKQIEPFLERYRTHCYVVNANGAMTYCRMYVGKSEGEESVGNKSTNKNDRMSILWLVQNHEHVRMLEFSETKQDTIQRFKAAFKQLPQVIAPQRVGKLMCWDFDEGDSVVICINPDDERYRPFLRPSHQIRHALAGFERPHGRHEGGGTCHYHP